MSRDEVQKLLGGYATGTLTPEERQALFAAALEDQSLFDQIAKEEPLRELMADRAVRAQLLGVLEERPAPWYRRWASWGLPALATAMIVGGLVVWRMNQTASKPVQVAQVTQVAQPAPAPAPAPVSAPASAPGSKPATASGPVTQKADVISAPAAAAQPKGKAALSSALPADSAAPVAPADKKEEMARQAEPMVRAGASVAGPVPPPPPPLPPAAAAAQPVKVLTGTVRDVTGAAVAAAEVKLVPTNANAPVFFTQTGANGNFVAPVSAGSYSVEVNSPGFQAFRRDMVTVDGVGQTQLPVTLQVGATTETVQVTAAAGAVQQQQGQQQAGQSGAQGQQTAGQLDNRQFLATPAPGFLAARLAPAPPPRILRRNADGATTPANANDLHIGDSIVIEITPAAGGYLTLTETNGAQVLVSGAPVEAGKPFDTPPIALIAAGQREFTASISDSAPAQAGGGGGGGRGGRGGVADALKASKKTTVAGKDAISPQPVTIRITVR